MTTALLDKQPGREAPTRSRDEAAHRRNVELKRDYDDACAAVEQAELVGDCRSAARHRRRASRASDELVAANLGFVRSVANEFRDRTGSNSEDHYAAALEGFWRSATRWNPDHGAPLTSFSYQEVRKAVKRSVASLESGVKLSTWEQRPAVLAAQKALRDERGGHPTVADIAARAGVTVASVNAIVNSDAGPVSIDAPTGDTGDGTLADTLQTSAVPEGDSVDIAELAGSFDVLNATELFVIATTDLIGDGNDAHYHKIGDWFGTSRETPRRSADEARSLLGARQVVLTAQRKLARQLRRNPTVTEIAADSGVSAKRVTTIVARAAGALPAGTGRPELFDS